MAPKLTLPPFLKVLQDRDPGTFAQVATLLFQKDQRLAELDAEVVSLTTHRNHLTGVLICLLRHHECFKDKQQGRFPMADLRKMEETSDGDEAIDTGRDDVSGEMVVSVVSAREYLRNLQGMGQLEGDYEVPKRPPFVVKVEPPEGATLLGSEVTHKDVSFQFVPPQSGKPDELGKPKNPREYSAMNDGTHLFTTDSAGLTVHIKLLYRKPDKPAAEEPIEPLTCTEQWHLDQDAPGFRCSTCGDNRKIETAVTVQ